MINGLNAEKKLPNMCLVLNGVDLSKKKHSFYYGLVSMESTASMETTVLTAHMANTESMASTVLTASTEATATIATVIMAMPMTQVSRSN